MFSSFQKTINANSQELLIHIDEAGFITGQHFGIEVFLHNASIGNLVHVNILDLTQNLCMEGLDDFLTRVATITTSGLMKQTVHVDGDDID